MKRKAGDDHSEGHQGREKRQLTETAEDISTVVVDDDDDDSASRPPSDDASTLLQPAPAATLTPPTVVTEASTATTTRRKFPSEEKTIPCTFAGCPKLFNRPARLLAHLRSHNNERPHKCTYADCDKAYADKKHLNGHILSAHKKEAKFSCGQCAKGFATSQRLKRHALVHQGEERYRCRDFPPCTQSFRKHQTLQRHVLKEHLGEKPYRCAHEGCGEAYDTANALKAHATREHGEQRFWCVECCEAAGANPGDDSRKAAGFTTQFLLDQHIRQEHVNCVFCDIKFNAQYELEHHMEIYHSGLSVKDRKTVPCDHPDCDKFFTKKSNMKVHYRTAHEGKRHVCGQVNLWETPGLGDWNWTEEGCGQGFTSKAGLEEHVLYIHLGKHRPQGEHGEGTKVPVDGLNFLDEISGVADHERRPVACTALGCGARFARYAHLHDHMRSDHPDQAAASGHICTSGMPQLHWDDAAAPEQQDQQADEWSREDANLMSLLNFEEDVVDPSLFAHS